jgi:hypothetical protein
VAGTDEQLAAVEELLKQLDQPPAPPPRLTPITLKHRSLGDPEKALLRAALPEGTGIAVDSPTRTILVRGSDADVSAVQALVDVIDKPVDQPSRILELTFFFLKSPSSGLPERLSQPVPAFLEPIAQALAKNGFRNPSLMTPLIVRTQENEAFSTSGVLTEAVTEAAADRATQGKLTRVVPEMNFQNAVLERAINDVRTAGNVNIVVRWNALEFAGIDRDTEVTVQLEQVPLEQALQYILDSVGALVGIDVGYVLDEGVLVISTLDDLREKYRGAATALQVRVEGTAWMAEPASLAHLNVEAEVCLPTSSEEPEAPDPLFSVDTRLTVPLGEYVVLAAGPVSPDVGQGIAMVVRAEVVTDRPAAHP